MKKNHFKKYNTHSLFKFLTNWEWKDILNLRETYEKTTSKIIFMVKVEMEHTQVTKRIFKRNKKIKSIMLKIKQVHRGQGSHD